MSVGHGVCVFVYTKNTTTPDHGERVWFVVKGDGIRVLREKNPNPNVWGWGGFCHDNV